ncbi:hypothetical protein M6B38_385855 [Iris pallida]|uniref:Uncharacterized protein n=1 Tax=Iris pallida TaxID=29817 RepID=A0AAX6G2J8_IRIPA|nr:hypothetical protein M6B38_385855 [Iris pallida]
MDRKNEIAFFFDDNQSTFYRKNSTAGGLKPPPSMKHWFINEGVQLLNSSFSGRE